MYLAGNKKSFKRKGKKEYIIPIIPEIIKKVDYKDKIIIIKAMDGLLN